MTLTWRDLNPEFRAWLDNALYCLMEDWEPSLQVDRDVWSMLLSL